MMTIPSIVKVGAVDVPIFSQDRPLVDDGKILVGGAYDPREKDIWVWNVPGKPALTGELVLHEIIEAIVDLYDIKHLKHTKDDVAPHQSIKTLSMALHQALSSGNVSFSLN